VSEAQRQFGNPEKGEPQLLEGITRRLKTQQTEKTSHSVCHNELQTEEMLLVVTIYTMQVSNKFNYQSKSHL
jgi:hypothetical protein